MKRWRQCYDCEEFFDFEDGETVEDKETGYVAVKCPCCGSLDTKDVNTCPMCGKPTENEDICDDCRSALFREVDDVIDSLVTDGDRDAAHEAAKQLLCDAWSEVF